MGDRAPTHDSDRSENVSLPTVMARSVGGGAAAPWSWPEISRYFREHYWNNPDEKSRRKAARVRHAFYSSRGEIEMEERLGRYFKDPEVLDKRREWVKDAKYNNVTARIVKELATVYAMPARRTVAGDDNNARYQELQRRCRLHEIMQRVNRWTILHRDIVLWPRVRQNAANDNEPILDVITPDRFSAIAHPSDSTLLIALSLDLDLKARMPGESLPQQMIWTAFETALVSQSGEVIESTIKPHSYGRIPGILFSLEPPCGKLLDSSAMEDVEAAHRAVWFENILLLKESKSATLQPVLSGDLASVARQQADDSERHLELPDGVSATTLDRAMDLSLFRDTARNIFETAAANHGLAPAILQHQGIQSADARELIRVPLRELRLQQQVPFRDLERDLASLMSAVYSPELPELAFTPDGWNIDFADPQTPLGTKEALEVFIQERQAGLTSTIAELIRRNPDLTPAMAVELMRQFIEDELDRNRTLRPLQQISGSMGAATPANDNAEPNA
jgi:hypothetical protein